MTPEELSARLERYAHSQGIELNHDRGHVMDLMRGLLTNESRYGYRACPCRLAKSDKEKDRDIICPCAYRDHDIKEFGTCYCGLYVSQERNMSGKPLTRIPERRPAELR